MKKCIFDFVYSLPANLIIPRVELRWSRLTFDFVRVCGILTGFLKIDTHTHVFCCKSDLRPRPSFRNCSSFSLTSTVKIYFDYFLSVFFSFLDLTVYQLSIWVLWSGIIFVLSLKFEAELPAADVAVPNPLLPLLPRRQLFFLLFSLFYLIWDLPTVSFYRLLPCYSLNFPAQMW